MSEKLKPCPFCGEHPHVFFVSKDLLKVTKGYETWKTDMYRLICPNKCCMQCKPYGELEEATAVWNARWKDEQ